MMQQFAFEHTEIPDLILVKPFIVHDERGFFLKDYSEEVFEQNGHPYQPKEVFYTYSHKGVIRAIHFQRQKTLPKLVRCIFGRIFDVVVDLRRCSPTFGKWLGFELSEKNKDALLIPGECGHGFLALETSMVSYKCAEKFYEEYDDGIAWDDPSIGINWPLWEVGGGENVILSEKDRNAQSFLAFKSMYGGL